MSAQAGWYPDTERPGGQRYWDGAVWTDHRTPQVDLTPPATPKRRFSVGRVVIALVLIALAFPAVLLAVFAAGGVVRGAATQNSGTAPDPATVSVAEDLPETFADWTHGGGQEHARLSKQFVAPIGDANKADSGAELADAYNRIGELAKQGAALPPSPSARFNKQWDLAMGTFRNVGRCASFVDGPKGYPGNSCQYTLMLAAHELDVAGKQFNRTDPMWALEDHYGIGD